MLVWGSHSDYYLWKMRFICVWWYRRGEYGAVVLDNCQSIMFTTVTLTVNLPKQRRIKRQLQNLKRCNIYNIIWSKTLSDTVVLSCTFQTFSEMTFGETIVNYCFYYLVGLHYEVVLFDFFNLKMSKHFRVYISTKFYL